MHTYVENRNNTELYALVDILLARFVPTAENVLYVQKIPTRDRDSYQVLYFME